MAARWPSDLPRADHRRRRSRLPRRRAEAVRRRECRQADHRRSTEDDLTKARSRPAAAVESRTVPRPSCLGDREVRDSPTASVQVARLPSAKAACQTIDSSARYACGDRQVRHIARIETRIRASARTRAHGRPVRLRGFECPSPVILGGRSARIAWSFRWDARQPVRPLGWLPKWTMRSVIASFGNWSGTGQQSGLPGALASCKRRSDRKQFGLGPGKRARQLVA